MSEGLDFGPGFDPVDPETWREHVEAGLRGAGYDSLRAKLEGGLQVDPLYVSADSAGASGRPGDPPFTRGTRPLAGWRLVHQACGASPAALVESARRGLSLEAGAAYLSPTACAVLERSDLEAIEGPVILDAGADALAWLGAAKALETVELRFDPLSTLARTGALPYDVAQANRWLAELATEGRRLLVDASVHHDAGATPADELGFALAAGVEHLRALADAGHPLEDAPRRLVFTFACDTDGFLSIAKLRAARLCWSKILRATGIDGAAQGMHVHAFESRRAQTCLDPLVGALRSVTVAFGAIVGGAEDISLLPHAATPAAERLAINTQHVLREESHLGRVADAGGGGYYVEALTEQLARAAWSVLGEIEAQQGAWQALLSGRLAERYERSADQRLEQIRTRRAGRVGVNRYAAAEDPTPGATPELAEPRVSAERAPKVVRDAFKQAARGGLASALISTDVSVEILRNELRRGDGELAAPPLRPLREAAPFEQLRARTASLPDSRRRALVIGVGDMKLVKPRMDFAREALLVAGLRVEMADVVTEAPALEELPPTVVVITSGPSAGLVDAAREAGAAHVLLAGPDEPDAGADGRLHRDMDVVDVLGALISRLEER